MATNSNKKIHLHVRGNWNHTRIMCQPVSHMFRTLNLWTDPHYPRSSEFSTYLFVFTIIMLITITTSFLLKPLGLPVLSRMVGGFFVMGLLFSKVDDVHENLVHQTVQHMIKTLSYLGFVFYSLTLGVETKMGVLLKRIDKETIIIGFSGILVSLVFVLSGIRILQLEDHLEIIIKLVIVNAQSLFMVTCNHVNELGISNSQLGRLACAVSLVLDICAIFVTYLYLTVIRPVLRGDFWHPVKVSGTYVLMFAVGRPLVLHILSYTPEGKRIKDSHFFIILVIILVLTFLTIQVHHPLAIFLFGFFLPEEPLASILGDKVEAINTAVFFPLFCAKHGIQADFKTLDNVDNFLFAAVMIMGTCGKLLGTFVPTMLFGVRISTAISLSILMACGGLLDIVILGQYHELGMLNGPHYTLFSLHILIFTGAFLPLVKYIYEPSTQYSTIIRQGVITSVETGTLRVLSCIYKEENLAGIMRLLQSFHSTHQKPLPVIALHLIPLSPGRVSLPILSPLHEIQSSSAYRSNLSRCNLTINAFVNLERNTNGATRSSHYISVSSYTIMHDDICNVAHTHNVSLIILPFHAEWTHEMGFQNASQSIRDVNKMVLEKAPCSIALLIDRGDQNLAHFNNEQFHIAIFFIGGVDDQEALAYTTIFANNNPNIRVSVIILSSQKPDYNSINDYNAIQEFQYKCKHNNRVSFEEVVVKNGEETTSVVVSMKDEIDLAVVGRFHERKCTPLFGLFNRWCEYPELGNFGDMLVSPDFGFSVLVVQQRPRNKAKKCGDKNDVDDDDGEDDL